MRTFWRFALIEGRADEVLSSTDADAVAAVEEMVQGYASFSPWLDIWEGDGYRRACRSVAMRDVTLITRWTQPDDAEAPGNG